MATRSPIDAGELDNALRKVETAFLGLRSAAFGALFPAFTKLAGVVTEFIVKNRDGIAKWADGSARALEAWVNGGGFERLIANVRELMDSASSLIDRVGGWKVALGGLAAIMAGPLILAVGALTKSIALLAFAFVSTPFGLVVVGIAAIAAALWALFDSGVFDALGDQAMGLSEIIAGLVTLDFERVVNGWTRALQGFTNYASRLDSAFPDWLKVPMGLISPAAAGQFLAAKFQTSSGGAPVPTPRATSGELLVSFANAPPGMKVAPASNSSQPVDYSVNYSVGPLLSQP